MIWFWLAVALAALVVLTFVWLFFLHRYVVRNYLDVIVRIFEEKPLFMIPFGKPTPEAEDISIPSTDGIVLKACYLKTKQPRKGVIFFGLEFGSKRWSCIPYTEFLAEAGYDIFACETRGQGETPSVEGYEPLQWITAHEINDYKAALAYLKARPDADPRGVGFFGLSKGGGVGVFIASNDPFIRCCVTDGIFGTITTMIPYMAQWVLIYTKRHFLASRIPKRYFRYLAKLAMNRIEAKRGVHYPSLARVMDKLTPRPLFMIHGGADSYIKPDMARSLFECAGPPKELWIVDNAKHNQAFHLAGAEYRRRVLEFFDKCLGNASGVSEHSDKAILANAKAAS